LLTAIWLPPGGSSTVHIYIQTIHTKTQNKQYIEQHNNFVRVPAVPRLCELYPGICPTTEEKARINLSQGSRRVPAGTMNINKAYFLNFYFFGRTINLEGILKVFWETYFNLRWRKCQETRKIALLRVYGIIRFAISTIKIKRKRNVVGEAREKREIHTHMFSCMVYRKEANLNIWAFMGK